MRLRMGQSLETPLRSTTRHHLAFLDALRGHQGGECVFWPFGKGRGSVAYGRRGRKAANVMCELEFGPPLPNQECAHSCNRGEDGCVNPRHLRWATHTENMADKFAHGTQPMGDMHYKAKVDAETALKIFNDRRRPKIVAEEFGVSTSLVHAIWDGVSWSHVTGARKRLRKMDLLEKQNPRLDEAGGS